MARGPERWKCAPKKGVGHPLKGAGPPNTSRSQTPPLLETLTKDPNQKEPEQQKDKGQD